jgi:hypothetical protein
MVKNILCFAVLVACCLAVSVPNVSGAEKKFELESVGTTVKDILVRNTGKKVAVLMDNGQKLEGNVSKVGDIVVHISRLTGREFYDAVIRLDRISAVILRTRTK